ncbi:hypothetical protein [Sulfuracidifex metallicus]|nr:hypothetical protein [Sulfuracidifex metallicus]MCY0851102.1 hypothetical protein [Sulfuracidifex metallicus]BBL47298.1 hypothetical protein MJ1HA_1399 [Metallosphaera sedula]
MMYSQGVPGQVKPFKRVPPALELKGRNPHMEVVWIGLTGHH